MTKGTPGTRLVFTKPSLLSLVTNIGIFIQNFDFIWDNKIAKIKKKTIIGERKKGGLNTIDFG